MQVIGFPRKTSESVVYQLSGTGFQGWNAGSVQRLLREVNAHLFSQPGGMDSEGGWEFFHCEQLHKHANEMALHRRYSHVFCMNTYDFDCALVHTWAPPHLL